MEMEHKSLENSKCAVTCRQGLRCSFAENVAVSLIRQSASPLTAMKAYGVGTFDGRETAGRNGNEIEAGCVVSPQQL